MLGSRTGILVLALSAAARAAAPPPDAPPPLRLHGAVEPVRSYSVVVPRLTGSATGTLVLVHLVKPGTAVKRGDLLIEFDRQVTHEDMTILEACDYDVPLSLTGERHMPTDQPGLEMRRILAKLFAEHGEAEVRRDGPVATATLASAAE